MAVITPVQDSWVLSRFLCGQRAGRAGSPPATEEAPGGGGWSGGEVRLLGAEHGSPPTAGNIRGGDSDPGPGGSRSVAATGAPARGRPLRPSPLPPQDAERQRLREPRERSSSSDAGRRPASSQGAERGRRPPQSRLPLALSGPCGVTHSGARNAGGGEPAASWGRAGCGRGERPRGKGVRGRAGPPSQRSPPHAPRGRLSRAEALRGSIPGGRRARPRAVTPRGPGGQLQSPGSAGPPWPDLARQPNQRDVPLRGDTREPGSTRANSGSPATESSTARAAPVRPALRFRHAMKGVVVVVALSLSIYGLRLPPPPSAAPAEGRAGLHGWTRRMLRAGRRGRTVAPPPQGRGGALEGRGEAC